MAKKQLDKCRRGNDFIGYVDKAARKHDDIETFNGKNHYCVRTPKGKGTLPRHNEEYSRAFCTQLIKMLLKLGVPASLAVFLFVQMYGR